MEQIYLPVNTQARCNLHQSISLAFMNILYWMPSRITGPFQYSNEMRALKSTWYCLSQEYKRRGTVPHPSRRGLPTVYHSAGFGIINATPAVCRVFKIKLGPVLSMPMTEKKELSVWLPRLFLRCVTSILCLTSVHQT